MGDVNDEDDVGGEGDMNNGADVDDIGGWVT